MDNRLPSPSLSLSRERGRGDKRFECVWGGRRRRIKSHDIARANKRALLIKVRRPVLEIDPPRVAATFIVYVSG